MKILGVALALLNLTMWFCTPALRDAVDSMSGRLEAPGRPYIMNGVQELLVYFDPWLARGVFPVVYTLGFAVIPFLRKPVPDSPGSSWAWSVSVLFLLFGLETLWLLLIGIGLFLRGPNWNLFWPGEAWDPHKLEVLNNVNLSDYFWISWMHRPFGGWPWWQRELPGLVLLHNYFLVGFIIAVVLYRTSRRTTPCWRWVVLMLLIQIAALVPLKMALRWAFNIKYLVAVPEYFINV